MTKYKVPEGMLKAAQKERRQLRDDSMLKEVLEAALRWLSENPIVPTDEQALSLYHFAYRSEGRNYGKYPSTYERYLQCATEEWQRRMFLAPEPEVPEEIKDLLRDPENPQGETLYITAERLNRYVLEAYKRGQKNPISS